MAAFGARRLAQPTGCFSGEHGQLRKGLHAGGRQYGSRSLAALLAPNDDVVQDLLTALQGDLLSQSVTAADLQVELHERRFSGVHGGTLWVIRQEPDQPGANRAAASPQPGGTNVIPAALLADLRDLNAKQQLCDQLARRVEDGRWLLYAIWYLWTNEQKQGVTDATKPRVDMLAEQIQIAQNALAMEQEAWNSAKKERDVSVHGINTELANYPKTQMAGTARLNAEANQSTICLAVTLVLSRS